MNPCVLCIQWPGYLEVLLGVRHGCCVFGACVRGWAGVTQGGFGPNSFLLGEIHIVYWLDSLIPTHHEPTYELQL